MPAQVEEVVGDADTFDPQKLLPDLGERFFYLGTGRGISVVR